MKTHPHISIQDTFFKRGYIKTVKLCKYEEQPYEVVSIYYTTSEMKYAAILLKLLVFCTIIV